MNYYELMKAAAIAVGRGGGSKDSGFVGMLTVNNPCFDIDFAKLELIFNRSSATSGGYTISPTTAFHYTGTWEWKITYRPKFLTSDVVCLLGTVGSNYANPTIEYQPRYNQFWMGMSADGSGWADRNSLPLRNFSEPITAGTAYSVIFGLDEESNGYGKLINADTGAILSEFTRTELHHNSNPSDYKACLLGNNGNSNFYLTGDIILSKTYYKENGVVLWGGK